MNQGQAGYSYQIANPLENPVNVCVSEDVNRMPEIVQIDDLTAIFSK
jgi:hypothetical protein